ncbi:MAG: GNAT family N-acetyltransferase [Gemmatimonadaceae bacterium]|nr:GNAT family N-acetyltransferase [Gemmatimonadaceae bacterium]MDQ3520476.1 GNAT family N-acetyltransferase [Gemmatimonadota bacterium]
MAHGVGIAVRIRPARFSDARDIAVLNNRFAGEGIMLFRRPEQIALSIDDYVVATDARGSVIACGALKEYAPSLAEVAAIAVAPEAHGMGLGKAIVRAVEELALKRGTTELFALTLEPGFFEAVGYQRVERAHYPEKIRRDCIGCARRFTCSETCFAKTVGAEKSAAA